jgi:hypothetical protein
MKIPASPSRKPGRPATRKDKNGRPMPVRADRDRPMQWFFEDVPRSSLDEALLTSGDDRFHRLHDALHDDTLPGFAAVLRTSFHKYSVEPPYSIP